MAVEDLGAAPRSGRLAPLWELLFPTRCLGCGRRGVLLCPTCRATVPWLPAAVCPRCAVKSVDGRLCRRCARGAVGKLASARAACGYEGVIRTAIHQLKFRQARFLAPFLARVLARGLAQRPLQADLVIPVPLSAGRKRERGYNQSELIAIELARLAPLPAPTPEALAKPRDTRPQVGLSAVERRRNVAGAFACPRPELVEGRRILLIDDVMTTGATLEACAAPLVEAGAARVMALVVARDAN